MDYIKKYFVYDFIRTQFLNCNNYNSTGESKILFSSSLLEMVKVGLYIPTIFY